MKTFYTRTLTALVFAVIMLGGMLWNNVSFCILFLIVALLGLREYDHLVKNIHSGYSQTPVYHKIIVMLLVPAGFLIASGTHFSFSGRPAFFFGLQLLLFLLMLLILLSGLSRQPALAFRNLGYSLLGLLYIGLPLSLMIHLEGHFSVNTVPVLPLGIVFSLWINDSLAYITGSLIGETPFFPSISPKKTWEGTLGGIFLTLVAGALYGWFSNTYSIGIWIAVTGITAITGTAGDLLESKIKRLAGVKDSGSLMPGHGGILDRFDSLILATPFVWLFAMIIIKS